MENRLDKYIEKALKGNKGMQCVVSLHYFFGVGGKGRNWQKSREWCFYALKEGEPFARGVMHYCGFETPIDYKKAFETFLSCFTFDPQLTMEHTSFVAYMIGLMYHRAQGKNKNLFSLIYKITVFFFSFLFGKEFQRILIKQTNFMKYLLKRIMSGLFTTL